MPRLTHLSLLTLCSALAAAHTGVERPGVAALTERERAVHVLNRLAFGPRPGEVDAVLTRGVDGWIDDQFRRAAGRDDVGSLFPLLAKSPSELREAFPPPAALRRLAAGERLTARDSALFLSELRQGRQLVGHVIAARVAHAVASESQLREVMTDFWLNHFSVFVGKNQQMRYYLSEFEREAVRPFALGRFRDMLGHVAKSPAMLIYLDNATSVADSTAPTLANRERRERFVQQLARRRMQGRGGDSVALERLMRRRPKGLNENYARELLELHTLGVDGGYTQADIIDVARALTGWTVRPGSGQYWFNGAAHDAGAKKILGVEFPGGRGEAEGERVLDLVAKHPSTARFIAKKLAIRFVSDSPSTALVERLAEAFRRSDGDIGRVMRTLVQSPEFFSRDAYRSKVKSPFEVVVSTARALGAGIDTTPRLAGASARLGQPVYGHQAPNGWPEVGEPWMNTGAILQRINWGLLVAGNRVPGIDVFSWPAYAQLALARRGQQVDAVVAHFLGDAVSAETRAILETGINPLLDRADEENRESGERALAPSDTLGLFSSRRERRGEKADRGGPPAGKNTTAPMDRDNQSIFGAIDLLPDRPFARQRDASIPPLTGLAQVIGLALGSPEFQRR